MIHSEPGWLWCLCYAHSIMRNAGSLWFRVIISQLVLVNTEKDYYAFITCEEVQASAAVKELKQTEAVLFTLPEATISETSQHVQAVLTFSVYNHPVIPHII